MKSIRCISLLLILVFSCSLFLSKAAENDFFMATLLHHVLSRSFPEMVSLLRNCSIPDLGLDEIQEL